LKWRAQKIELRASAPLDRRKRLRFVSPFFKPGGTRGPDDASAGSAPLAAPPPAD
jgi:hypothetical protein